MGRIPSRGADGGGARQILSAVVAISIVAALGMSAGLIGAQPDLADQFIADGSQDAPGSWSLPDGILSVGTPQYAFAQNPDSTPPTFVSSGLDSTTGVLTITFSETIDVTPATNVVPTKIHIRESGNYTGGTTLSAGELGTTADGTTISFTLTASNNATVAGLTAPELTIEPGAVRDTSGNLIDGTFDVSTLTHVDATSISDQEIAPTGMAFSNNGLKMFVIGTNGDDINEYTLSTAFDASTLTHVDATSIQSQENTPGGMAFSNDGLKMFVIGFGGGDINEYNLTAAFDASTLTHVDATPISDQESFPSGMAFSNDGLKMFVVGTNQDNINEYTLTAAFDASTRTHVDATSISSQDNLPGGMAFSNDGLKMFVIGGANDNIYEYTLSTAFDASTRTFVDATSILAQELAPTGMAFSNDGTKMFVIGSNGREINEYTLSSVYPITMAGTINNPPVANAGPDMAVDEGGSVTLQGSGSDDDNDSLTYSWSSDSRISFNDQNSATPTVTASSVTADTQITLTLTVSDGTDSHTDTMVLTIRDVTTGNLRPTVSVGPDQTVKEGESVSMPWTAADPDGDALTHSWSQNPALPQIPLNSPNSSPTTFTAPLVTNNTAFTFTLTVTAGTHMTEDSLTITVKNNRPPAVDAGSDRTVNERTAVTLSGSASDPDGDALTYAWTHDSGPSVDLTGADTVRPQFMAPGVTSDDTIVFTFAATDGSESVGDTVAIMVRDVPITVSSATYNPGSGTITITFNQDINGTPDYSKLYVRGSGSDSEGIALSDVEDRSHRDRTITATLSSEQQEQYDALQGKHLDVEAGAVTDIDGVGIEDTLDVTIRGASSGKRSSTPPPAVDLNALASRGVDIPPHIAELASSRGESDPIAPTVPDGTFDYPLVINGSGYLLDNPFNTLVPHTVMTGQPIEIMFTVYSQNDLAHFALYLNLQGNDVDYSNSDTHVTYRNDGTVRVSDPHGYISNATVTISQDKQQPEKKIVTVTIQFDEPMGQTNMVAYLWDTEAKSTRIGMIGALDVMPAPVTVDPETGVVDPEPAAMLDAVDPEPASQDSADSPLLAIRTWSGFEPESITDAQLLASLGLDYPGVDIPSWVMTELGPLAAKGDITVGEFKTALTYVLDNT